MVELSDPIVDICIVCSDFEESLRFYRDVMGFEVALDVNITDEVARKVGLAPKGFRQVRLKAGETLIKLMGHEPPPAPGDREFKPGVRWLTFFVSDVRSTYEELQRKGVPFLGEPVRAEDTPGVVCALDPDGILVELVQR